MLSRDREGGKENRERENILKNLLRGRFTEQRGFLISPWEGSTRGSVTVGVGNSRSICSLHNMMRLVGVNYKNADGETVLFSCVMRERELFNCILINKRRFLYTNICDFGDVSGGWFMFTPE